MVSFRSQLFPSSAPENKATRHSNATCIYSPATTIDTPLMACRKEHHPCYPAASCSRQGACRQLVTVMNVRACSYQRVLSCTYLSLPRPSTHDVVVLARMLRVEVRKDARVLLVVPDLAHQPRVNIAH